MLSLYRCFDFYRFLLAVTLIVFGAFLILTRMHERYLFPLFIPLTILCVKKIISLPSYIVLSLVHLINLYHLWWFPSINSLISLFSEPVIEKILIIVLLFIFMQFNKTYFLLKNDFL